MGEKGSGEWEQITWDEAVSEIAEKWKAIVEESGPGTMAGASLTGNFGSVGGGAGGSAWQRFKKLTGMSSLSNDIDAATKYVCSRMMGSSYFNTPTSLRTSPTPRPSSSGAPTRRSPRSM